MSVDPSSNPWLWWWRMAAPQNLSQPILPGWSLISITENNSSAPETERRIVEKKSYGRQIGRTMDAVAQLIKDLPPAQRQDKDAYDDLIEIHKDIQEIKLASVIERLEATENDLDTLKTADPDQYKRRLTELEALVRRLRSA